MTPDEIIELTDEILNLMAEAGIDEDIKDDLSSMTAEEAEEELKEVNRKVKRIRNKIGGV